MKYYLGIDIGGTEIKIGIISDKGAIIYKASFKIRTDIKPSKVVQFIANCALTVTKKVKIPIASITGAGIGAPGIVNPIEGLMNNAVNFPQINNIFIARDMSRILGIPVSFDNDVNAMALGEMLYGAAKGYSDVICLTLGTGVGGGLIFNGKLYRGATFSAGEIGHLSINADGLHCPCGNYGCIERYVGRDGIINRFNAYFKKGIKSNISKHLDHGKITPLALYHSAKSGDALSLDVLKETGTFLGVALASLTNILNPEVFVIGGAIANAGDLILEPARIELRKRAYAIPAQKAKIVQAMLGNDAGIVGAATLPMIPFE